MDRIEWIRVKKHFAAVFFFTIAAWVMWHGRNFNPEKMGLTTLIMCALAGFAFMFTGYRMVLVEED